MANEQVLILSEPSIVISKLQWLWCTCMYRSKSWYSWFA